MSTGYKVDQQDGLYFLTFQVVEWIDVFTRRIYVDSVLESLSYCRKVKGLKLWAYVIMSNHVHVIISAENENLSDVIRDFRRYTTSTILKAMPTKGRSFFGSSGKSLSGSSHCLAEIVRSSGDGK